MTYIKATGEKHAQIMKKFWDNNDEKTTKNDQAWTSRKEDYRALFRALKLKTHDQRGILRIKVVWGGIEPPTQGFSELKAIVNLL